MAESIERFAVSEKGYSLPINDVLTGRGFVTGKSGSGKSNTASVVAEELLDRGLGLMIIDTDGEYAALKERYELLQVGGDDACDREITAEDAPLIADLALEENVPIILDVSGYMDEEVADDVIHAVVRELFVAEKQHQKPFLLFVEEAHEFIPERGGGDDIHKMLVRVAKRGRKRGLGIVAMSQRPAAVAKDYITQCDWLVWHRLTWENDTKVAGRILGGDAAESVQSLDDGEALVMTDWDEKLSRVQFRRKKTVDKGSTPTLQEAYGPPSDREDHVTQPVDEAEQTGDSAESGGSATDADGAEAAAGDSTGSESDADGTSGSVSDAEDSTVSEQNRPAPQPGSNQSRASNWDLDDVDIEPRQPTLEGGRPAESSGSATRSLPASNDSTESTAPAVTTPEAAGGQQRTGGAPPVEGPDEYDPLWEIAQLIVYTYGRIRDAHCRFHARWKRRYIAAAVWVRRSTVGSYRHGDPGRIASTLGSVLSVSTILLCYALAVLTLGVLLPTWIP
ncbi:helicase HerA domain-containing protein [Halovivax limisalsi]|uniref:helicase HerA domain-containing protein n=1 Tax=Halovivax limisalsi TaxID=1453760 RepID=UPI001FFD05FE|nr:DUF87 domain-containing protein [Halovivax limisalsi]